MKKGFALIFVFAFLLTSCANLDSSNIAQSEIKTEATTVHVHTWTPATCTAPKTCSVCGATEGEPTAHLYEEGVCSACGFEDQEYIQFQEGKAVYVDLLIVKLSCDTQIDKIQKAWYYHIYKSDDYYGTAQIKAFSNYIGFKEEIVREAAKSYLESINWTHGYDDLSLGTATGGTLAGSIYIVQYIFKDLSASTQNNLNAVRDLLGEMTEEYEKTTKYSLLKQYYAELKSYASFCQSPSGSYSGLQTTKYNFQTNATKYQNELSITYSID